MEYRDPYRGDRIELGEARQEYDQRQLHARGRQRLLRLRSDQEESRHRIEFPRSGLNPALSSYASLCATTPSSSVSNRCQASSISGDHSVPRISRIVSAITPKNFPNS